MLKNKASEKKQFVCFDQNVAIKCCFCSADLLGEKVAINKLTKLKFELQLFGFWMELCLMCISSYMN